MDGTREMLSIAARDYLRSELPYPSLIKRVNHHERRKLHDKESAGIWPRKAIVNQRMLIT